MREDSIRILKSDGSLVITGILKNYEWVNDLPLRDGWCLITLDHRKENLLFILVDCLRADKALGENSSAKTLTINSLRNKGATFRQMIAVSSTTTPCVASIFTGLLPFSHGIRTHMGFPLNPLVKPIAEVLKENGYHTYAEVTGPLWTEVGLNRGFDEYNYRSRDTYFCEEWGTSFIERLRRKEFEEPWFIFLHLWELHQTNEFICNRYVPKGFNRKEFGRNSYARSLSGLDLRLGELLRNIDHNNTIVILHGDHGERISSTMIDEFFLKMKSPILRFRRKLNTLFSRNSVRPIIYPDIGEGHGFQLFDYLVKVPFIISGGSIPNIDVSLQVSQIDIYPLIVAYLGLELGEYKFIQGRNLLPILMGENLDEVVAYSESLGTFGIQATDPKDFVMSARTSKYKLISRPYKGKGLDELYNIQTDPLEKWNIKDIRPEVVRMLKREMNRILSLEKRRTISTSQKMTAEEVEDLKRRLAYLGYIA